MQQSSAMVDGRFRCEAGIRDGESNACDGHGADSGAASTPPLHTVSLLGVFVLTADVGKEHSI